MQVLASHQAERALPPAAETSEVTGKIVALSVLTKAAPGSGRDLPAISNDGNGLPTDLAASLLEELQRARFREARRLKRVETLEHEIRVSRAQNEALRSALQSAQTEASCTSIPTPADSDALGGTDVDASAEHTLATSEIQRQDEQPNSGETSAMPLEPCPIQLDRLPALSFCLDALPDAEPAPTSSGSSLEPCPIELDRIPALSSCLDALPDAEPAPTSSGSSLGSDIAESCSDRDIGAHHAPVATRSARPRDSLSSFLRIFQNQKRIRDIKILPIE